MGVNGSGNKTYDSFQSVESVLVSLQADIRTIAQRYMSGERVGHTLSPTALVNEVFLRLVNQKSLRAAGRGEVLAAVSHAIRWILVDHARRYRAEKRGGNWSRISPSKIRMSRGDQPLDLIELNDVLELLRQRKKRVYRVVVMRFFGGMTVDEVAEALSIAPRTVANDWDFARSWLGRKLGG